MLRPERRARGADVGPKFEQAQLGPAVHVARMALNTSARAELVEMVVEERRGIRALVVVRMRSIFVCFQKV